MEGNARARLLYSNQSHVRINNACQKGIWLDNLLHEVSLFEDLKVVDEQYRQQKKKLKDGSIL